MPDDPPDEPGSPFPTDRDVAAVVEEFGGDPWAAIRALLSDLEVLAADYDSSVSHGFVRGVLPRIVVRKA